jgi:hypothetical protein
MGARRGYAQLPALQVILSHEKDLIVAAHNLASPNLKSQ